jgi:glucose-1-phosphatase
MKIKAIIFDIGRVLIDVDFTGLFKKYLNPGTGPDFSFTLEEVMHLDWFVAHSTGKTNDQEFYWSLREIYKMDISFDDFKKEWSSIFRPVQGMEKFVKQTAGKYPVSLLSDTDPIHWSYLVKNYPYLNMFRKPVLSFEIGVMKPAKECYERAAISVNTPIENCLFIDDRQVNVDGAINAGMQAVQFSSVEKLGSFFVDNNL